MAKSKKIEVKNIILTQSDDKILHIKGFEDEEIPFENLSQEIQEMIKLGSLLNIKISKARKSGGAGRKPTYKYKCEKCGKEIKSTEENLEAKCLDCDCNFIKEDK